MSRPIVFGSPEANAIAAKEPKLVPCPFCGGIPEFVVVGRYDAHRGDICKIYCPDCQVYAEQGERCNVVNHWNERWKG